MVNSQNSLSHIVITSPPIYNTTYTDFVVNVSMSKEPKSYLQAKEDSDWCIAMKEELDALENNHTWYLTQLPKEKKIL